MPRIGPLQGAVNFRDLGGLGTEDGRRTRHGLLFRSNGLEELTPDDVAELLDRVGLRTVFDLRSPDEAELGGPLAGTPVRYLSLPFVQESATLGTVRPMTPDGRTDVPLVFRQFMEMSAEPIRTLFEELASDAMPALVHCAAGKDRTGVAVALVLRAVGVTERAVIEDFAASGPVLPEIIRYLQRRPAYADVVLNLPAGTMDADPNFMRDFLADVDERHGGMTAWLVGHAGVARQTIAGLRSQLVAGAET